MVQWRGEVERYCRAGSLTLTIYHGPKRVSDADALSEFDVVLTTYAIVQTEYSAKFREAKETCPYCKKKYFPPQMAIHHKFFCGPNAKKSAALAKQQKKRPGESGGGGKAKTKAKTKGGKRKRDDSDDSESEFDPSDAESSEEQSASSEEVSNDRNALPIEEKNGVWGLEFRR